MEEFVFGTLSDADKRVGTELARRRGVSHRNRLDPPAPRAGDRPVLTVLANTAEPVERILCTLLEPTRQVIALQPAGVQWHLIEWQYAQVWQAELPAQPDGTLVRYTVEAWLTGRGRVTADDAVAPFAYYVGDPAPPAWTRSAVIYQVLPDRFHPGPGRVWPQTADLNAVHGGMLAGVTAGLDDLTDLGVTCLWLNPFFPDDTHHGYHATDYFAVNPRLGTPDDLRRLVAEAHRRGMRLVLDFVANHWGSGHATFQAALADPHSDYVNWYRWQHWPDRYETFFGVQELPQLNVDYPAVRDHLLDAARYWATEFGFDGFRLDYAVGPSHAFWAAFRQAVKQARPDAWIFGEVVEDPDSQLSYRGRFDGCLDFLLAQALRRTFGTGRLSLATFDHFLTQHEAYFPAEFSRPTFLDNHDMDRFLFLAGGDRRRLQLAALCQMTLSGPPILYYGTEVGVSQARAIHDPRSQGMAEARRPLPWSDGRDEALRAWFRDLIHLRRQHPVFWQGDRQTAHLDPDAQTYAYTRRDGRELAVVAFNLSDQPRRFTAAGQAFDLAPLNADVRVQDVERPTP